MLRMYSNMCTYYVGERGVLTAPRMITTGDDEKIMTETVSRRMHAENVVAAKMKTRT